MGLVKALGFNDDEVDTLINKLQLGNKSAIIKQNIKDWYNGYTVSVSDNAAVQVYTPWLVMSYLKGASLDNLQPKGYWSKTTTSIILQRLLRKTASNNILNKFEKLTAEQEVEFGYEPLTSLLKFEEDLRRDINIEEAFSHLLFNAGYLTARTEGVRYYFKIPNFEAKRDFALVIRDEI